PPHDDQAEGRWNEPGGAIAGPDQSYARTAHGTGKQRSIFLVGCPRSPHTCRSHEVVGTGEFWRRYPIDCRHDGFGKNQGRREERRGCSGKTYLRRDGYGRGQPRPVCRRGRCPIILRYPGTALYSKSIPHGIRLKVYARDIRWWQYAARYRWPGHLISQYIQRRGIQLDRAPPA